LNHEIYAQTVRDLTCQHANICEIAGAVERAKAFAFLAKVEWLARLQSQQHDFFLHRMAGIIKYAYLSYALALDLILLCADRWANEEAADQRSES
jgi:hypothetical protein